MSLWREYFHLRVLLGWDVLGWILAALIAVGGIMLAVDQFTAANVCFVLTALFIFGKIAQVAIASHASALERIVFTFALSGLVGIGIVETIRVVNTFGRNHNPPEVARTEPPEKPPNGPQPTPPMQPPPKPEPQPLPPPPIIKKGAFSTLIPFVISNDFNGRPDRANIARSDNRNDPLSLTYSTLAGISYIQLGYQINPQTNTLAFRVLTDDDIKMFLSRVLQYFLLQCIAQQQHTVTYENYETGKGATVFTSSAVLVPDEAEYPREALDELFKTLKISIWQGGMWIWKQYPLKVPSGAKVSFPADPYAVRLVGKQFRLDYTIEMSGRNKGAPPRYFALSPGDANGDFYSYIFVIGMDFRWTGDRTNSDAYIEWAQELFDGLRKKLVLP